MLWQSLLYSKVIPLYTYTHSFFKIFFSIMVDHRILNIVPCATEPACQCRRRGFDP